MRVNQRANALTKVIRRLRFSQENYNILLNGMGSKLSEYCHNLCVQQFPFSHTNHFPNHLKES